MSSSQDPELMTNWIVVRKTFDNSQKLYRHGPYSNAISDRDHEAALFYKELRGHHIAEEIAAHGEETSFSGRDVIQKAFVKLLNTGTPQKIEFREGAPMYRWDKWGEMKVERGHQADTATALKKLIAGENPGGQGPSKEPDRHGLHLYTVLERKWPISLWEAFWTYAKDDLEDGRYNIDERKKRAEHHMLFYKNWPLANVDAIGSVETFKNAGDAMEYAKARAAHAEPRYQWFCAQMDEIRNDHEFRANALHIPMDEIALNTLSQFRCSYPNPDENDRKAFPNMLLVVEHAHIEKGKRHCQMRVK
ncbi:hypothetical protein J4E80_003914 [Alternaria sp. BMP 0032]|nr:hypothetical protein J4E80_003914 [Alternaria sp. BMP 0032]